MRKVTRRLYVSEKLDGRELDKRQSLNLTLDIMTERGRNTENELKNYLLRCVDVDDQYWTGLELSYDEALRYFNELVG